jgi:hypothetical protein
LAAEEIIVARFPGTAGLVKPATVVIAGSTIGVSKTTRGADVVVAAEEVAVTLVTGAAGLVEATAVCTPVPAASDANLIVARQLAVAAVAETAFAASLAFFATGLRCDAHFLLAVTAKQATTTAAAFATGKSHRSAGIAFAGVIVVAHHAGLAPAAATRAPTAAFATRLLRRTTFGLAGAANAYAAGTFATSAAVVSLGGFAHLGGGRRVHIPVAGRSPIRGGLRGIAISVPRSPGVAATAGSATAAAVVGRGVGFILVATARDDEGRSRC